MDKTEIGQFKNELAQFNGAERFYRHPMNQQILFTDGVKFFAERAGAFWLLDILATELNEIRKVEEFIVVRLNVTGSKAVLISDDGNDNVLHTKNISLTDAPEGEWKFYMVVADRDANDRVTMTTIMLPSEY
ncbi:DUF6876 family protein [Magnetospirillum molischianum]|uniref:DUF6876 domain-containing protein n=1 Tax=Magnetospirillum molischianum DSM 120 TaxID=1150626 RepID=H8FXZ8_MAGML|nr:DUF6876 family protein [Magnetospirillum molischianum]CCG43236.1 hypothetical protein PHAMO_80027 [Magnetospirillum molischianum DSM 120]